MELAPLAAQVVAALAPALPFLLDKSAKEADAAIEKMGEDAWEKAKTLWARLRDKVAADADPGKSAERATEKLARDPDNDRQQRMLALLLEELLEGDESTVAALRYLLGTGGARPASGAGPGAVGQTGERGTEWTRSVWGPDWEEAQFKYPYVPDDGREDLKSPSALRVLRGGGRSAVFRGSSAVRFAPGSLPAYAAST